MVKRSRRDDLHNTKTQMKLFNKALIVAASSIALVGGAMTLITPPSANAYELECRNRLFGGGQDCSSSSGGSWTTQPRAFGGTDIYGTTGSGRSFSSTCSTSFGVTRCY